MPSCAAFNCTNRPKAGCGKSFHLFPHSNAEQCKQWVIALRRAHYKPSKGALVCSDHFQDECFDRTGQTIRLRQGAIPTVFNFPPHLLKVPIRARKPPTSREPTTPPAAESKPHDDVSLSAVRSSSTSTIPDHPYFTSESPRTLKRMLNKAEDEHFQIRKKLKVNQQKNRRLRKKISSLQAVVQSLRAKQLVSCDSADVV